MEQIDGDFYLRVGRARLRARQWNKALDAFQRGLRDAGDYAPLYAGVGEALLSLSRFEEAVDSLETALRLQPRDLRSRRLLIYALHALGRHDQTAQAWCDLGVELENRDDWTGAITAYQQAIRLKMTCVTALANLGRTYVACAKPKEALRWFEAALAVDNAHRDAHVGLARASYLTGDHDKAWREFEHHTFPKCGQQLRQPEWSGGSIEGRTILLWQDQGLGDAIQYLRYAPLVRSLGARVYVECHKSLVPVLRHIDGISAAIPRGAPLPPFDVHAPLFALPRVLYFLGMDVPAKIPYIAVDPELTDIWRRRLGIATHRTVGVVWGSRAGWRDARFRSIPLALLEWLAARNDVRVISLQLGPQTAELSSSRAPLNRVEQLLGTSCTVADTAALILALDLVITVDTMVAHLAGALAKPVWTLLRYAADWKWLLDGDTTSWYPTMRLFRQSRDGDWQSVMKQVESALDCLADSEDAPSVMRLRGN